MDERAEFNRVQFELFTLLMCLRFTVGFDCGSDLLQVLVLGQRADELCSLVDHNLGNAPDAVALSKLDHAAELPVQGSHAGALT